MVKIRLRRVGSKKQPSFRVVVADSRAPRDGRFIEEIGFYNPRTEPETLRIDDERALHWLSVGAQPTDSVARLLRTSGTMDLFERLKEGESLENLLAEAEEEEETPETDIEEEVEEAEAEESLEVDEIAPKEPAAEDEAAEEAEEAEAEVAEGEPEEGADEAEEEDKPEE
jgi:small subunit ribosomal protein S16